LPLLSSGGSKLSRKFRKRCARPLGAAVLALPVGLGVINIMKAKPMSYTTWNMTLTVRSDKNAVHGMRDYLRLRGIIIPMRDRDVVSKYMHRIIENGNARTSIEAPATVTSPHWNPGAAKKGSERGAWADLDISPHIRQRLRGLALGSFGLLVMLACYITFGR
jgi:hypothetical protein